MAAIYPSDLTYVWTDSWQKIRDGSYGFSGGHFFLIGKRSTVGDLGLAAGNNYKFTFHFKYAQEDSIQVKVVVKTKDECKNRTDTISKSTGLIEIETDSVLLGDNFDTIEFFVYTTDVKAVKGVYIYSITPSVV
ncbi:hypothetical protein AXF42_Ash015840 [Apostasia shenzhenica]|uniref:Uncharacterized protein n=1 Tax=Apostasia shenzhenica TaxID=1088818 RepID=A0A2H9ZXS1_9ASPA|nr:hypothetical protein AXF42_Ash015840 [Apostasia shenzhenica]